MRNPFVSVCPNSVNLQVLASRTAVARVSLLTVRHTPRANTGTGGHEMNIDAEHSEQLISLYGGSTPVRSRWTYRAAEPFTVAAAFQTDRDRWVEWIFGRDLLVQGLSGPAGEGDVRLVPDVADGRAVLLLEIESPDGHALLEMEYGAVQNFLAATVAMVPLGTESDHFDIDALIEEITNV